MPSRQFAQAPPSTETWTSYERIAESSTARQPTTKPASPVDAGMTAIPASGGVVSWRNLSEIAPYSAESGPS